MKSTYCLKMIVVLLLLILAAWGCSDDSNDPIVDGDGENGDGDVDGDFDLEADALPSETTLNIMTYNVLCSFCNATYEPWEDRLPHFTDIFTRHEVDIVGTQELFTADEVNEILALNPNFEALYYIDDPDDGLGYLEAYPDEAILYRTDRFEVIEHGNYWLSETPDVPWAGGWAQNNFWRLVGWAHFRQISDGREFVFVNTHFDNNVPNQENSAPLFISRIEPWAETLPVIAVGDFNSKPDSPAYAILTEGIDGEGFALVNSFDIAENWRVQHNQAQEPDYDPIHRIDHIFLAGPVEWTVSDWVVDLTVYGPQDQYPSDHYPIATTLTF